MPRKLAGFLALALLALLAVAPAGAMAAPVFDLNVTAQSDPESETPGEVTRADKVFRYTIAINNSGTGGLNVGEPAFCTTGTWTNATGPYAYRWARNGVDIPGETTNQHVIVAEDAGKALQCIVTAENATGKGQASSPPMVIGTPPSPAPPVPPSIFTGPTVAPNASVVESGSTLTCKAGTWTNAPTSYTYQYYRNGEPIGAPETTASATATAYVATPADVATPGSFQCSVRASNASGGAWKGLSTAKVTSPAPIPAMGQASGGSAPAITSPPATMEITVPPGITTDELLGINGLGWSCTKSPPSYTCTRTSIPKAGAEAFPTMTFNAYLDGKVAPDTVTLKAKISGGGSVGSATGEASMALQPFPDYGARVFFAKSLDKLANPYTQAGGHPYVGVTSNTFVKYISSKHLLVPIEDPRDIKVDLPPGFLGNPLRLPKCDADLIALRSCPPESQLGTVAIGILGVPAITTGVFAVKPTGGHPAEFAFMAQGIGEIHLYPSVRSDSDYGITMTSPRNTQAQLRFIDFKFWGTPADPSHDSERCFPTPFFIECTTGAPSSAPLRPLLTNPTNCSPDQVSTFHTDSWQHPDEFHSKSYESPPTTGCDALNTLWTTTNKPTIGFKPDTTRADTPTGYSINIHVPQEGIADPEALATPNLYGSTVTLPAGVAISPAAAHGLTACSEAQMGLTSRSPVHFNLESPRCPDSSKIGTMEVQTPVLADPLIGSLYLAAQDANPFGSRYALYLTIDDKVQGLMLKLAGKVVADPVTGQLKATFLENPQLPFTDLRLRFFDGPRAALTNPTTCGTYTTNAALTPWSAADPHNPTPAETANSTDSFTVASAPAGACAPTKQDRPFNPSIEAGSVSTRAGASSDFILKLRREDGEQELSSLDVVVPKGLTASLRGVPYCTEASIAAATARASGKAEQASPSCPAASRVGTVTTGAGAGDSPLYVDGNAYLAGPYKGAPLSLAIVTPAVAGPFDLGNVVVRAALYLNPVTAQITVKSDPIPQILEGIPLGLRSVTVRMDRPGFTRNPTSCEPSAVNATAAGASGRTASPSTHFQVGFCRNLEFSPKLKLDLKGGTKRNDHPALTATLTQPEGQANIGSVQVALPHSEFLDQAHIRTVCTRVQFAERACPPGSVYGSAEAISPLLDTPLSGPVYLRSSDNKLPDLVVALRGPDSQPIEINLAGRIDSINGGIRNSFELIPDAAVSKFVLKMKGGKKGLLVNSRNLCTRPERATVRMIGQNGKRADQFPKLANGCRAAKKPKPSARR